MVVGYGGEVVEGRRKAGFVAHAGGGDNFGHEIDAFVVEAVEEGYVLEEAGDGDAEARRGEEAGVVEEIDVVHVIMSVELFEDGEEEEEEEEDDGEEVE